MAQEKSRAFEFEKIPIAKWRKRKSRNKKNSNLRQKGHVMKLNWI